MTISASENRLPTARVLTVAGSDSGGGAGIQADLKAMMAHGVHGMSVLTAITAQNSVGVQGVWGLPAEAIETQFRSVVDDIGVDAIKTGMLGDRSTVELVARLLEPVSAPKVVDPVAMSKHGDPLIAEEAVSALREKLLPVATLITPNLPEAAWLAEMPEDAPVLHIGARLLTNGTPWVLIKGGHAAGDPIDHLFGPAGFHQEFPAARADNRHTHGTGCTLASTLAARLGLQHARRQELDVSGAMAAAKAYITGAVQHGFALGRGIGPVDHLWQLRPHLP